MEKITFYKLMRGYNEQKGGFYAGQGKYRFGYHFEQSEGALHICKNGIKVALEKDGAFWSATEITTGCICGLAYRSKKALFEHLNESVDKIKDMVEHPNEYMAAGIEALKAYAKQQRVAV